MTIITSVRTRFAAAIFALSCPYAQSADEPAEIQTEIQGSGKAMPLKDTLLLKPEIRNGLEKGHPQRDFLLARDKRIVCLYTLAISAASMGFAAWQNNETQAKSQKAVRLYGEMMSAPNDRAFHQKQRDYAETSGESRMHKSLRDGFYVNAAVFSVPCALNLFSRR